MPSAYLDHAATTPLRPEARAAVVAALEAGLGNPSGSHGAARRARRLLDDARDQVADALGARPGEVVFTSGGTEADNLAITGSLAAAAAGAGTGAAGARPLAVCSAVEHHAVLEPVRAGGGRTIAVDALGRVDVDHLQHVLRQVAAAGQRVAVASVMAANNEVGTVQPLAAVADALAAHAPGAVLHVDAVAAAPWLDLAGPAGAPGSVARADLVAVSGHKVGGPTGSGALVVRTGTPLAAQLLGGGQERERRSGTPNLPGAVGLAAALAATVAGRAETVARVEALRARLAAGLVAAVPDLVITSPAEPTQRTAGTVHACVPGIDREALLFLLDEAGVAASWGSSCASGASEPSHVLAAMGVDPALAAGALRLSLGWCSTDADVDHALSAVPAAVVRLRAADRRPEAVR